MPPIARYVIVTFLLSSSFCSLAQLTTWDTTYHENGRPKAIFEKAFEDIEQGEYFEYYDNGTLKIQGNKVFDIWTAKSHFVGTYMEFDKNGHLVQEGTRQVIPDKRYSGYNKRSVFTGELKKYINGKPYASERWILSPDTSKAVLVGYKEYFETGDLKVEVKGRSETASQYLQEEGYYFSGYYYSSDFKNEQKFEGTYKEYIRHSSYSDSISGYIEGVLVNKGRNYKGKIGKQQEFFMTGQLKRSFEIDTAETSVRLLNYREYQPDGNLIISSNKRLVFDSTDWVEKEQFFGSYKGKVFNGAVAIDGEVEYVKGLGDVLRGTLPEKKLKALYIFPEFSLYDVSIDDLFAYDESADPERLGAISKLDIIVIEYIDDYEGAKSALVYFRHGGKWVEVVANISSETTVELASVPYGFLEGAESIRMGALKNFRRTGEWDYMELAEYFEGEEDIELVDFPYGHSYALVYQESYEEPSSDGEWEEEKYEPEEEEIVKFDAHVVDGEIEYYYEGNERLYPNEQGTWDSFLYSKQDYSFYMNMPAQAHPGSQEMELPNLIKEYNGTGELEKKKKNGEWVFENEESGERTVTLYQDGVRKEKREFEGDRVTRVSSSQVVRDDVLESIVEYDEAGDTLNYSVYSNKFNAYLKQVRDGQTQIQSGFSGGQLWIKNHVYDDTEKVLFYEGRKKVREYELHLSDTMRSVDYQAKISGELYVLEMDQNEYRRRSFASPVKSDRAHTYIKHGLNYDIDDADTITWENYRMGTLNGFYQHGNYGKNGYSRGHYKDGIKSGKWKETAYFGYNEVPDWSGRAVGEGVYKKGVKKGTWRYRMIGTRNGYFFIKHAPDTSYLHGDYKSEWAEARVSGSFKKGVKAGVWTTVNPQNGRMKVYENYAKGYLEKRLEWGIWDDYDNQAKFYDPMRYGLLKMENYKNGVREGLQMDFYADPDTTTLDSPLKSRWIRSQRYYENGEPVDTWSFYGYHRDYSDSQLGRMKYSSVPRVLVDFSTQPTTLRLFNQRGELSEEGEVKIENPESIVFPEKSAIEITWRYPFANVRKHGGWRRHRYRVTDSLTYENGLLVGPYVLYYLNGQVQERKETKEGVEEYFDVFGRNMADRSRRASVILPQSLGLEMGMSFSPNYRFALVAGSKGPALYDLKNENYIIDAMAFSPENAVMDDGMGFDGLQISNTGRYIFSNQYETIRGDYQLPQGIYDSMGEASMSFAQHDFERSIGREQIVDFSSDDKTILTRQDIKRRKLYRLRDLETGSVLDSVVSRSLEIINDQIMGIREGSVLIFPDLYFEAYEEVIYPRGLVEEHVRFHNDKYILFFNRSDSLLTKFSIADGSTIVHQLPSSSFTDFHFSENGNFGYFSFYQNNATRHFKMIGDKISEIESNENYTRRIDGPDNHGNLYMDYALFGARDVAKSVAPFYIYNLIEGRYRSINWSADKVESTTAYLSDENVVNIATDSVNLSLDLKSGLSNVTGLLSDDFYAIDQVDSVSHIPFTEADYLSETLGFLESLNTSAYNSGMNSLVFVDHSLKDDKIIDQRSVNFSRDKFHFYNAKKEKSIERHLALMMKSSGDYVLYAPDNYYMATKDATEDIHFTLGMDSYDFSQFDLKYNRPDIIMDRLGYADSTIIRAYRKSYEKRLKKMNFTEDMLQDDFNIPELEIQNPEAIPILSDSSSVRVGIEVQDQKYLLDRINVFINGVAVFGTGGIDLRAFRSQRLTQEIELPLGNGTNQIELSVLNQAGAESYKKSLDIAYSGGKQKPDLYLVSIGVSNFQDDDFNLKFAAKDARDVASLLSQSSAYEQVHSLILTNEDFTKRKLPEIRDFIEKARIDDKVLVFIAGHGLLSKDLDYFLATYDTDFNEPEKNGIAYSDMEGLFDGITALKKIFLIDACHSGEFDKEDVEVAEEEKTVGAVTFRAVGSRYQAKTTTNNMASLTSQFFSDLRRGTGTTVLSAAGGLEYAIESDDWNNGLFTFCLLNGIKSKTADLNGDGEIWLEELQQYVADEVVRLSGGQQRPTSRIKNEHIDYKIW